MYAPCYPYMKNTIPLYNPGQVDNFFALVSMKSLTSAPEEKL
jgi:hypothetical protein